MSTACKNHICKGKDQGVSYSKKADNITEIALHMLGSTRLQTIIPYFAPCSEIFILSYIDFMLKFRVWHV